MNITLIGMAGAGKSTVGRELAAKLSYSFVDVDIVIEREEGEPLNLILDRLGDSKFVQHEAKAVLGLTSVKNAVIATGGSMVYSTEAMEFLRRISFVAYLFVPMHEIKARILDDAGRRGIVGLRNRTLDELFAERQPLYRKYAHATFYVAGIDPTNIAFQISAQAAVEALRQ